LVRLSISRLVKYPKRLGIFLSFGYLVKPT